jgi:hypothetical protein
MPGAVGSDAFHYMAQGIGTEHGRHHHLKFIIVEKYFNS